MTNDFRQIDEFLGTDEISDDGFTNQIMSSLPSEPKIVWLTSWLPVLGLVVGILFTWALGVLNVSVWNEFVSLISTIEKLNISDIFRLIGIKEYMILSGAVLGLAFWKKQAA